MKSRFKLKVVALLMVGIFSGGRGYNQIDITGIIDYHINDPYIYNFRNLMTASLS